jgi:hypothetical protein
LFLDYHLSYENDFQENILETFENCLRPSINQIIETLAPIYFYLIIYQIVKSTGIVDFKRLNKNIIFFLKGILTIRILNIFNIIGCFFILKQTFSSLLLSTLIVHFLIAYLLIKCVKRYFRGYNGISTTFFSLIYILTW